LKAKQKPDPCPGDQPCGHSDAEHKAFDLGLRAAEAGFKYESMPKHYDDDLLEAWANGFGVGQSNRLLAEEK